MGPAATTHSDLDLVIITDDEAAPYRESFTSCGWPVEAFVHTLESAQRYFISDARGRRPVLARMVLDGHVLVDRDETVRQVRAVATDVVRGGPPVVPDAEVEERRYFLTDLLDDLRGVPRDSAERWFVAHELTSQAVELFLANRGAWSGNGKGLYRALVRCDPATAHELASALDSFGRNGDPEGLIRVAEAILREAGGPVFEGFRRAGRRGPAPGNGP